MDVSGTVITYNPDLKLLKDNLSAAIPQVSRMLVYDNGSGNVAEIRDLISALPSVDLIENGENLGLPVNYNKAAREIGGGWLLILDQDTVLPEGYVEAAGAFFEQEEVSIICCPYWDSGAESLEAFRARLPSGEVSEIDFCISSGSICRVRDIFRLGGFDERMFIDIVDYDYCRTVVEHGLKILQMNRYYIRHSLGVPKQVRLLSGKRAVTGNHSAFRKYYIARNAVYYVRKHKLRYKENRVFYKRHMKMLFLYPLYEEHKWSKCRAILKGIFDGLRMKID